MSFLPRPLTPASCVSMSLSMSMPMCEQKRQQEHDRKVEELNKEVTRLKGQVLLLTANRNKAAACKENEAPSNDDKTDTAQHTDKGNDTSDDNSQVGTGGRGGKAGVGWMRGLTRGQ